MDQKNNLKTLKEIVKYQSYPLPTPQAFATALICRKIKFHGYKVMLSGAGGDEFFAGYYHHFLAYLYSIQANKNFNQIHKTWKRKISKYIRSDGMKNFKNFKWNVDNRLSNTSTNQHEEQELKKYVARKINLQTHKKYSNDFYINMILQDVRQNSLRHQLDSLDSIAMFYSIEGRSPFLSSDIFNFLTSLPRDYFFNKCRPKSLLRDALKDYIPKSIFNNLKKVGFYISFKEIFSKKEKRNLYKMITNSNLLKNILNMKEVKKLMKRKNMKHSEAKFLFSAANMAILGDIYDY